MKNILMVIIWGIFLAACVHSDNYLKQGRDYMAAGDWDKSAQFYREAMEKYPRNKEIRLMLKGSKWRASASHQAAGEKLLKHGRYNDAVSEFQMSLAMNPDNHKAAGLIEKTKNMRQAAFYAGQGKNLLKTRQFRQAREAFEKALDYDPEHVKAKEYLTYFEKQNERPPKFRLRLKNRSPISLKFKNTPVMNVFEILSQLTGVNFIFDKDVKESNVTLFMTDVSFDRFIEVLLETNLLDAKIIDEKTMLIYPANSSKTKAYQDLQIRTFYLSNLKAKKVTGMLSKVFKNTSIIANEDLNAVVIRAPQSVITLAGRVIEANDRPVGEALLNVEILEVSRTKEQQLGLDASPTSLSIAFGDSSAVVDSESILAKNTSLHALATLSKKELMLAVPTAIINFLKQDSDTQTLANPQIRVTSGKESKILIGERIPLRTNRRVDTTGVVTFDFQYFDVGVKLNARPVINIHGQISLDINLEISSLGPNLGTSDDPQYSIRTRTAQSMLTVLDGESVIIGGLINDEEQETMRKIPFLGDLPLIGRLFTNQDTNNSRTDIIMAITPVITRTQDVPDIDIAQIWSGAENRFSLAEPYESIAERKSKYADKPLLPIPQEKEETKGADIENTQ